MYVFLIYSWHLITYSIRSSSNFKEEADIHINLQIQDPFTNKKNFNYTSIIKKNKIKPQNKETKIHYACSLHWPNPVCSINNCVQKSVSKLNWISNWWRRLTWNYLNIFGTIFICFLHSVRALTYNQRKSSRSLV